MRVSRNISRTVQNPYGIAGILHFSSFLILSMALIILIASGALPGFSANLQGSLEKMAPDAMTFCRLDLLWTVGWMEIGWSVLWPVRERQVSCLSCQP